MIKPHCSNGSRREQQYGARRNDPLPSRASQLLLAATTPLPFTQDLMLPP